MNIEDLRTYCLSKPGVSESFPFDESTLVFKVLDKMFLLTSLDEIPPSINVKADPETVLDLRERYRAVLPGYHMNKKHWNTVLLDGSISDSLLHQWIDDSYGLVVATLPALKKKLLQ